VVSSVRQWDMLSRRWRQRKAVQQVTLIIFDELHFLGGELGPSLEVVISRTRYMNGQLQGSMGAPGVRIVALSASLANARDVGEWMGVPSKSLFNFSPTARPSPLEVNFLPFEQSNFAARLLAMAKPVYHVVSAHCVTDSSLVFVPSRRQAQLTAIDLMTYRQGQGAKPFGGSTSNEFLEVVSTLREPALQQVAREGIGFVYQGMLDDDMNRVSTLFGEGSLRVLVVAVDVCWRVQCRANLVVIMGTESFDGREGRHVDYPLATLLHMVGRYNPNVNSKCAILCHSSKRDYLKKLLSDPLPVESHLDSYLHDPLNAEVVTRSISSMQDAIDYMTWTFLYRRLAKNPTYYGLRGTSNAFLSEHLSEMIETVVGDLEESKCCKVSETGEVSPLNLGMIAAYYYVQYRTIELVASSITEKTKLRGVLEVLSASWEFSMLPIRFGEEKTLRALARNLLYKLPADASYDSNTKTLILLQCHFSRKVLPPDLRPDLSFVLKEATNLIQAIVDVISSNGWLKPALASMELSQMVVQGLWNKDNVLKQIPHFSDEIIKRCQSYEGDEPIESVLDILTLDDDVRNDLLQLTDEKMADVAVFCNNYPNVDLSFKVQDPDSLVAGEPVQVVVDLQRELDEDEMEEIDLDNIGKVSSPFFPGDKKEAWWIVVGDMSNNTLLSLKRVNLQVKQTVTLEFLAPEEAGDYDLTLFCMCDSYLGCDQEMSMPLSIAAADSDDEESADGEE
jgi:pre-mRNA-splicing helicase BRR2